MWSLGISLIELALGRFPFSDSDDDSDLSDFEGTLSPSRPLPPKRTPIEKDKKKKRKSKGVSLQGGGMTMSILELLQHIVNEPAPRLTPEGRFPKEAEEFVDSCLLKDPDARKTPKDLLVGPPCVPVHVRHSHEHHAAETPLDRTRPDVEVRPRGVGIDILNHISRSAPKHIEYLRCLYYKPLLAPHARPRRATGARIYPQCLAVRPPLLLRTQASRRLISPARAGDVT